MDKLNKVTAWAGVAISIMLGIVQPICIKDFSIMNAFFLVVGLVCLSLIYKAEEWEDERD